MEDYQDTLSIATPEGVTVDLVLGGLGSRFAAASIDLVLKVVVLIALGFLLLGDDADASYAIWALVSVAFYVGYDIAFESLSRGRTPGKRLTGLRVLRTDGRPVDVLSSAIRNVVRLVDGATLMYLPGMVSILLTRRNQRLGDLAAGTIVVRERLIEHETGREWPLAEQPPLGLPVAPGVTLDLTQITAQDLVGLQSFLDRRSVLPPDVRHDLAARLAGAVRPRVGGAAEALGDEQLIEKIVRERG